jgi:hypothetical protein
MKKEKADTVYPDLTMYDAAWVTIKGVTVRQGYPNAIAMKWNELGLHIINHHGELVIIPTDKVVTVSFCNKASRVSVAQLRLDKAAE